MEVPQFLFGKTDLVQLAENHSRPFYFYDLDAACDRARAFVKHGASVHYAMKANSNERLLRSFAALGLGVDVVSLGEMQKALALGIAPQKIIFSGVGKDREELESALQHRILQINVESFEELQHLEAICQERRADMDVALRLNIHIEAPTHKHIQTATPESKFGLDQRLLPDVLAWLKAAPRRVKLKSLTVHIGSQILDAGVFEKMSAGMGKIFSGVKAQGFALERLDLGGGLGIDYKTKGEDDFTRLDEYMRALLGAHKTGASVMLEPGRFLVARMGVLLAKVVYVKKSADRQFAILNAGMNHLMRPALYQAYHRIEPLVPRGGEEAYDVVGPICESTDVFAYGRKLPRLERGDWVGLFDAGAYGAVMANTYNESQLPEEWSVLNGALEVT
jgi:diaminopimelate decarboxylase